MTFLTFAIIFLLGSLFGASLMLLAVARAMNLIALQRESREFWFKAYLTANSKAFAAQEKLDAIHRQHVEAGKKAHEKRRQLVRETAARMKAEIEQSRQPELREAA